MRRIEYVVAVDETVVALLLDHGEYLFHRDILYADGYEAALLIRCLCRYGMCKSDNGHQKQCLYP